MSEWVWGWGKQGVIQYPVSPERKVLENLPELQVQGHCSRPWQRETGRPSQAPPMAKAPFVTQEGAT